MSREHRGVGIRAAAKGRPYDEVALTGQDAMDDYVRHLVKVDAVARRIVESDVYTRFFAAAPGVRELVLLGRIRAWTVEAAGVRRRRRWDLVVVDAPSSGHGILLLETPFAARRAIPIGGLGTRAQEVIDWLRRADTRLVAVALPEEMAVVEAIESADRLRQGSGLEVGAAILNRVRREKLSAEARRALAGRGGSLVERFGRRAIRRNRETDVHARRLAARFGAANFVEVADAPETHASAARIAEAWA